MAQSRPVKIYAGQPGTSEGVLYTAPAGGETLIKSIIVSGITGTGTVSLSVVPKGGTAGNANRILNGATQTAGTAAAQPDLRGGTLVMNPGDFLSGVQSVAGNIGLYISGERFE